jgi:hypothetical protein
MSIIAGFLYESAAKIQVFSWNGKNFQRKLNSCKQIVTSEEGSGQKKDEGLSHLQASLYLWFERENLV